RSVTTPGGLGSKIAFTRTEVAPLGEVDSNLAEIWVMNGDGTGRRQLTRNATFDLGATWSPDGQTVAFYSGTADGPHVFLIPAAGGDQTPLLDPSLHMRSRFPSWSNSGRIAFDNGGKDFGDIFTVNPDGSGLEQLTDNTSQRNIRPDWSPNG